jgi:glycosidase
MSLFELLRAPALQAPKSLAEQLQLIRKLWTPLLGDSIERFLIMAGEILREEEIAIWMQFHPPSAESSPDSARRGGGPVATADVPTFGDPAHEYEKFSPDTAWMPTVVLIAKSTYVWLAQLSRQYGRSITRLDEIPEEELQTLANRGLNTLWLIGIWERSRASRTIKQLCGNHDAVASAYSLYDYAIAENLGGEAAYIHLRDRAYHVGIRLASDMVPNHMGLDSPWVVEHPEWFMSRNEPPYPTYSFNGPDLSADGRVEIKIDDHYFNQSDAAVVFQRRNRWSGETRYIYHGNDGTSFPWNDTAQLDYMNPAVREQVIQTILHVARLFPVIRFDAAMTLAKRHFHRLWFPGPGASGAIPSRAEYGLSDEDFNRIMPQEFWREVVDRVAAEVPGTLLLAEAFWLMEGYFVRTLGMHRVYNSAFMVMLRDEENAKYRSVIKNTLEFDPDIMKRYVNFMSNPDERTAIDQFGKGDKCFGVATMMATLPGLPMFGHGQIEGFTEKYGMEYYRPRYEENPDHWLVERHQREIAPLLKRRWLFAESANFLLYDFFLANGMVDENVFAYSNRVGDQRALVIYNNRYGDTQGTIHNSAAFADKAQGGLRQRRLAEALGLEGGPEKILAWRDSHTGLEYLRRAGDITARGLTFHLHAYQSHVLLDWREVCASAEHPWDRLCDQLNGVGVPNLEEALINLELRPVHDALKVNFEACLLRSLADLAEAPLASGRAQITNKEKLPQFKGLDEQLWLRTEHFLRLAQNACFRRIGRDEVLRLKPSGSAAVASSFHARLRKALELPAAEQLFPAPWTAAARRILPSISPQIPSTALWGPILGLNLIELLAEAIDSENPARRALDLFDRLRLREPLAQAFAALGMEGEDAWRAAARIKLLILTNSGIDLNAPGVAEGGMNESDHAAYSANLAALEATLLAEESPVADHEADDALRLKLTAEELQTGAEADATAPEPEENPLIPTALWRDPDLRWLAGVHAAQGHEYIVREPYEEMLWWFQLPLLLHPEEELTAETAAKIAARIEEALAAVKDAGYRVEGLAGKKEKE